MRLMGLPLIGIGSAVLPSPTDGARTPLEDRQPTVNRYRHRVLSVQLLGDITVERDGVPVVLSGPRRRLLTFLALHPGPHDRDALAARFWPDTPTPRASLRTAVWALRQSLGADALVATRASVALGNVTRDIDDPDRDGEPWPALDDDWAEAARVAHHEHRIARFDAQIAAADDPVVATALATRRCALAPLTSRASRLDRAARRRGRPRRCAARGPNWRPGCVTSWGWSSRPPRVLCWRACGYPVRPVRSRLRGPGRFTAGLASWRSSSCVGGARDGRGGRVVLVTGEAGIGKTRLISEVAQRVSGTGARVAVGAGVDVGGEAPLAVWQELARELVAPSRRRRRTPPGRPNWAGWPPISPLRSGTAAPRRRSAAPELERLRIFDAVLRLVEWAARDRPVLVVAEDVHRADRASLALARTSAGASPSCPCCSC